MSQGLPFYGNTADVSTAIVISSHVSPSVMPPRRKPTSLKQKKADQQLKRAIKRGDAPPPDPKAKPHRKPKPARVGPTGQLVGSSANQAAVESTKRLQSAFIKLTPEFLEKTKNLASTLALPRPIPVEAAVIPPISALETEDPDEILTCPKRPKWRFDMSKKEVEKNEEGIFKKWLTQTDQITSTWQDQGDRDRGKTSDNEDSALSPEPSEMPRAPTYYERNIEVWRQLCGQLNETRLLVPDSPSIGGE